MTRDEIVGAFRAAFDALDAEITAVPDGPMKIRAEAYTEVAHRALERLRKLAVDDGMIQPLSGGGDKPPGGP